MVHFPQYKILVRKPHRKFKRRLKVCFSEIGRQNVDRINPDLDMCSVNLVVSQKHFLFFQLMHTIYQHISLLCRRVVHSGDRNFPSPL